MKYLFLYGLIVIGLVYLYRGYLVFKKNRINMMSGVSSLTPDEKLLMCPIVGPYYMIIGILVMVIPFVSVFIGNLGWYILLIYIIVGSFTISQKRTRIIKQSNTKK